MDFNEVENYLKNLSNNSDQKNEAKEIQPQEKKQQTQHNILKENQDQSSDEITSENIKKIENLKIPQEDLKISNKKIKY